MVGAPEVLKIAWWNTGLTPVKSSGQELADRESEAWERVVAVASDLIAEAGVDLLFLGEVCAEDMVELGKELSRCSVRVLRPAETSGRPSDVGALAGERVMTADLVSLSVEHFGKSLAGRQSLLTISATAAPDDPISIFVVHWPSRMFQTVAEGERMTLATELLRHVQKAGGPVIVLGDFNDEPFDASIRHGLQATRVRETSRDRSVLYNASWRHLGERRALEDDAIRSPCAGTHRWAGDYPGGWVTLDQMLFSSHFIDGSGWRLREGLFNVIEIDKLESGEHHPIMCAIERAGGRTP